MHLTLHVPRQGRLRLSRLLLGLRVVLLMCPCPQTASPTC
jgi:hypothetical protein